MLGTFPQELFMSKKMLLAGLLAAIVMFVWSSIAHTMLPTREAGIGVTENEDAVLASLKANVIGSGMYFLPGVNMVKSQTGTKEERQAATDAWQKQLAAGPRALIVYHPTGAAMFDPKMLVREFLSDIAAAFIIVWMLLMALPNLRSFASRVLFVTFTGLLPWIVVDFSYWNWFEFPTAYAMAQMVDYVVGALLAGIFLAWFYRKEAGLRAEAKTA
jgi:hypothetical protein